MIYFRLTYCCYILASRQKLLFKNTEIGNVTRLLGSRFYQAHSFCLFFNVKDRGTKWYTFSERQLAFYLPEGHGTKDYRRGSVTRSRQNVSSRADVISARSGRGGFGYPTPSSEPVTSRSPLCLLLLFHSNQLEKRRTLSLSALVGSMVHWPRSLAREWTPGRTPLKYHVSYGRKKSRCIHTQIGTRKVSSLFLFLYRVLCELQEWLFLSSGSLRAVHERVSLEHKSSA